MTDKTLLLVEDDVSLNEINRRALEMEGYRVHTALTLRQARERLATAAPDLVLLDVKLPDGTGFDFCKELRANPSYAAVPILFLTSFTDDESELMGLRSGGNDYLRKPYGIELLCTRVAGMLKLLGSQKQQDITFGQLTLNAISGRAYLHGEDMLLTQKEFALLLLFVQHDNCNLSADHLYEKVWGQPMNLNAGAVKIHVSNLRKKLAGSGNTISASRGEGYCFGPE